MSLLSNFPYDLFPDRNSKHTEIDKQLISEQYEGSKNYNPLMEMWRYKLIDKKTNKFYKHIIVPRITQYTTLRDQFDGKYNFEKAPYRKYSPRKIYWLIAIIWGNKREIFNNIYKSNISKQVWIIVRTVIGLLIAYTIWGLFGDQIIEIVKRN